MKIYLAGNDYELNAKKGFTRVLVSFHYLRDNKFRQMDRFLLLAGLKGIEK